MKYKNSAYISIYSVILINNEKQLVDDWNFAKSLSIICWHFFIQVYIHTFFQYNDFYWIFRGKILKILNLVIKIWKFYCKMNNIYSWSKYMFLESFEIFFYFLYQNKLRFKNNLLYIGWTNIKWFTEKKSIWLKL